MKDTRILAPFSGVIGARMISPGQVIAPQQMLTMIADLDPVKVELNVPERFMSRVANGQKIELTVAAFPAEKFVGEVYFIAPQLDPVNRTGLVKAKVANSDLRLKPGMFASLDLTLKVNDEAVVIPEAALMPQGDHIMVYVVDEQMTAQLRPVKPGLRQAGRVEIVEGIKEGETVVIEGWQKARPGGKVRLAPSALALPYLTKETKSPKAEEDGIR
jgi:membrane fusion protein (multidrug efflux system)